MLTAPNGKRHHLVVENLNISLRVLHVSQSKWTKIICARVCHDFQEICIYGLWLFAGNFQEIIARLCAMQWSAKIDNKLYQRFHWWNYLLQNQSIVDWNVSGLIYIWIPSSRISLTSRALNIRPYAWCESFPADMSRALKWRKYQERKFFCSVVGCDKDYRPATPWPVSPQGFQFEEKSAI